MNYHSLWSVMAFPTGEASVSGAEEPGEAASHGAGSAREEAGAHSTPLHARIGAPAGQHSHTTAPWTGRW